jgi:hypothetical protein
MDEERIFPESLVLSKVQPFFSKPLFQHLPIRALGKENGVITRLFTTDTFDFTKTAGAHKVKSNAIGIWLNEFVQARSQFCILSVS